MASKKVMHNSNREFSAVTASGTKYEFSKPDEEGWRTVLRKAKSADGSDTMMVKPDDLKKHAHPTDRKEFTGKLKNDVQSGMALYIDIKDENRTLVSEKVVKIST